MRYADSDGELAVQIACAAIEARLLGRSMRPFEVPARFEEKTGAFVTLNSHPDGELRGCIGYPQPFFPLAKTIEKAAEAAATDDPRFPPMRPDELDRVTVEVSILTPPRLIEVKKPKEMPAHVTIGVDGLSIAQGAYRGILLPQVAIEENFDAADFLSLARRRVARSRHSGLHVPGRGLRRSGSAWACCAPEDGGGACGSLEGGCSSGAAWTP